MPRLVLLLWSMVLGLWSMALGMDVLPAYRISTDWAPKYRINAFYYKLPDNQNDPAREARFFINSTIPAVNLDNVPHITSVRCLEDNATILLNFTDPESASFAHRQWFLERESANMSLYINHHYECFGKAHVQAVHVNMIEREGVTLKLDTHWLNHTIVYGNYEVFVGDYTGNIKKRDTTTSKIFDFNVNYENGKIINQNITLFDFRKNNMLQYPRIAASCIDCHTKGNATFSLYLKSENGHVMYYRIEVKGIFHSNSDFRFNIPKASEKRMMSFAPIFMPIGPVIDIPGLFFFGHQFGVVGSWSYAANLPFHLDFGFETTKSFYIVIESPITDHPLISHLLHAPNITHLPTIPAITKHHKSIIENTTDITYALHLSPMIDISFRLFQINMMSFRLSFDTAIGVETRKGNALVCTNVDHDYAMYTRDTFNFDIGAGTWGLNAWRIGVGWNGFAFWRKHFELWATKFIHVQCDFCADESKCPVGYVNHNRTRPEKGKLDNFS